MKNNRYIRFTLVLLTTLFIFNSCSNLRIEKRQHQFGYHVHWTKKYRDSQNHFDEKTQESAVVSTIDSTLTKNALSEIKVEENTLIPSKKTVEEKRSNLRSHQQVSDKPANREKHQLRKKTKPILVHDTAKSSFKKQTESSHIGLLYFLGLLIPLPFIINRNTYKYSKWAAENKQKSISLLIFAKVLLAVLSVGLGYLLGIGFSPWVILGSAGIILTVLFVNIFKKNKGYLHRKVSTYGMSVGSIGLFFSLANTSPNGELVIHPLLAFLLTILTLAALVGVLYLIILGTCSLSCSGYEVLAAILFFGGVFLSVFGTIALLLYINRRYYSPPVKERMPKIALTILLIMIAFVLFSLLLSLSFG